jgi:hypothetical protein
MAEDSGFGYWLWSYGLYYMGMGAMAALGWLSLMLYPAEAGCRRIGN